MNDVREITYFAYVILASLTIFCSRSTLLTISKNWRFGQPLGFSRPFSRPHTKEKSGLDTRQHDSYVLEANSSKINQVKYLT